MRVPIVARLSAMCVVGAALTASASVSANPHYYAQLLTNQVGGNADDGAFIDIWTNILGTGCNLLTGYQTANHEFWYLDATETYWVEAGWHVGETFGAGCHFAAFFWADQRNGGGYNEHMTNWGLITGDWESFQISTAGSCAWSVFWEGGNMGTSTSNCLVGRSLEAGVETTSQTTGNVKGWLSNWKEQDGSGTWRNQWDGDGLCQGVGTPGQPGTCTSGNPQIQWQWSMTGTEEVLNENW